MASSSCYPFADQISIGGRRASQSTSYINTHKYQRIFTKSTSKCLIQTVQFRYSATAEFRPQMPLSIPLWVIRLGLEGHVFYAPFRFRLILKSLCVWIVFIWSIHKGHYCWKKRIIIVCSNVQIIETRTQRVNITLIMRYKSSHRPESLSVALSKVWVSLMYEASQSHSNKNRLRNTAANTRNTF